MLRSFIKEGGLYSLSGIITKGIGILLIPFYTQVFTTSDYGMLDLISVMGGVVNIVFPLQITHGVARHISDGKVDEKFKVSYSSTGLIFTLIAYSLFVLVGFLFSAQFIDSILFQETPMSKQIFLLAVLSIAINGVFYFFQHQLKWIRKVKIHSILAILHSVLTIAFTIILVLVYDQGIAGVFMATLITTPFFIIAGFYYSRSCFAFEFSGGHFKEMLYFSFPIVFQSLSLLILTFADKVLLKEIKDVSETGIYGIAYRIASVMHILFTGFSYALGPLIYGSYHEKESNAKVARIFHYFLIFSFTGALAISLFSLEILQVFTQPDYYGAYQIVPILCLVTLANGFQMFFHGLSIAKKTLKLAIINITAAVINIGLNYLFIPEFGGQGAAVATLIATVLNLLVLAHYSQKEYKIPLKFLPVLIPVVMIVSITAAFLYFDFESNLISILVKGGVVVVFGLILTLLIDKEKLVSTNLKKVISYVRNRRDNK